MSLFVFIPNTRLYEMDFKSYCLVNKRSNFLMYWQKTITFNFTFFMLKQSGITYKNVFYSDLKELDNSIEKDILLDTELYPVKCPFFLNLSSSLPAISTARAIFIASHTPFDDRNELHIELLHSLYFSITKSTEIPERTGSHWEVIGFQGSDPVSDLRGTGILGLYLPFQMFAEHQQIAKAVINAAHTPGREFPMMLILIAVAGATINVTQNTDILLKSENVHDGFRIAGLFFAGTALMIANEWNKKKLNFFNNFGTFDKITQMCIKDPMKAVSYAAENI